ncbi:MAG: hypothetical protein ACM3QS_13100 [Bacteroidota bacterium]
MSNANRSLLQKLDAACQWVERSEFRYASGISKEHTLAALRNLKRQFIEKGCVDSMEASMLFAPTGGLQEVAIENGWGSQFLEIADDISRTLQERRVRR